MIIIRIIDCFAVDIVAFILIPTVQAAGMPPSLVFQQMPAALQKLNFLVSFGTIDAKQRKHSDLVKRGIRCHH